MRVVAHWADPQRIFGATELRALLTSAQVTSIEGIPIAELREVFNRNPATGLAEAFERVRLASEINIVASGLTARSPGDFMRVHAGNIQQYLADNPAALERLQTYWEGLPADLQARRGDLLRLMASVDAPDVGTPGGSRAMTVLGQLGAAAGLTLAASQAVAAYREGDSERARDIMQLWAVESVMSSTGSAIGTTVGRLGLAAAAAAGVTVSAPVAGALVLGAALAGGFFGSEGSAALSALLRDRDDNERLDLLERLGTVLFGADAPLTAPLPPDLNGGQRLELDASIDREEIVANALQSAAWRYALRELNPFVVNDVPYTRHNADGSLDLLDEVSGTGTMSARFLADRAAMLDWLLQYRQAGARDDDDAARSGAKPVSEEWDTRQVVGNWDFVDLHPQHRLPGNAPLTLAIDGLGVSLHDHQIVFGSPGADTVTGEGAADALYGMAGADTLDGAAGDDHLEGHGGDDTLRGGDGRDALHGGAGRDTLDGGAGDDRLDGGLGDDVYVVASGSGFDTIVRSEAGDRLRFADRVLTGAGTEVEVHAGLMSWVDRSNTAQPIRYSHDANRRELSVSGAGSAVVVLDFDPGDLGIRVPDAPLPPPAPPAPSTTVDLAAGNWKDQFTAWANQGFAAGRFLNVAAGELWRVDGSRHADLLTGGLTVNPAATDVPGDFLRPGAYHLAGRAGDDRLFAVAPQTEAQALAGTPSIGAFAESVRLDGGEGHDFIVGSAAADLAFGGSGDDRIITGAGDDVVLSDGDMGPRFDGRWLTIAGRNDNGLASGSTSVRHLQDAESRTTIVRVTVHPAWVEAYGLAQWSGASSRFNVDPLDLVDHRPFAADSLAATTTIGSETLEVRRLDGSIVTLAPGTYDLSIEGHSRVPANGYHGSSPAAHGTTLLVDSFNTARHAGADRIDSGAGDDVVNAGGGDDIVRAGSGNDAVAGHRGNDLVFGEDGDDHLHGDHRAGVDGDAVQADAFTGLVHTRRVLDAREHGDDRLYGGAGRDLVFGGGGHDLVDGGDGDDQLWGDEDGLDVAGAGRDRLFGGAGDDLMVGGAHDDQLFGDAGNDVLRGDFSGRNPLELAGAGDDLLDGGEGDDHLIGDGGNDVLSGGAGDDRLEGGDGNDRLDGGAGLDSLAGGAGDDVYVLRSADFAASAGLYDVIDDREGRNTLRLVDGTRIVGMADAGNGDLWVDLDVGGVLIRGGLTGAVTHVESSSGVRTTLAELARVHLSTPVQLQVSTDGREVFGGSGNDRFMVDRAGARLEPGAGRDSIDLSAWLGGHTLVLRRGDGLDTIVGQATVGATGRPINAIEFAPGVDPASVQLALQSVDGVPQLVLRHGSGGDGVVVDIRALGDGRHAAPFDELRFAGGPTLSLDALLARGVEVVATAGAHAVTGTPLGDVLSGHAGFNQLDGGAGNDVYRFGRGDGTDVIVDSGPTGDVDTLELRPGLAPQDLAWVRGINGLSVTGTIRATGDRVTFDVSGMRAVERVRFADGTQLAANALPLATGEEQASAGNDQIVTGDTDDRFDAGAGDDRVWAGGGRDVVRGGSGADALNGEAGDDELHGDDGNDTLAGGDGRDTLIGGDGVDQLAGGDGDDLLVDDGAARDGSGAVARLIGGPGRDTLLIPMDSTVPAGSPIVRDVEIRADAALDAGLDTLRLGAADPDQVTVRRFDVDSLLLLATSPVNGVTYSIVLRHQARGDGLVPLERVRFDRHPGVEWSAATLRQLAVTGSAADDRLWGFDDADDELIGGAGHDELHGAAGRDTLDGGAGQDLLVGGSGDDTYRWAAGDGRDRLVDHADATGNQLLLGAGITVSNLQLTRVVVDGAGLAQARDSLVLTLAGSSDQLWIDQFFAESGGHAIASVRFADGTVWSAADLQTRAGPPTAAVADPLIGGAGDDVFTVDHPRDTIIELAGGGFDTVRTRIGFTLPDHVEQLELEGFLGVDGYGNALDNVLRGNGGANLLDGRAGRDRLEGGDGDDIYAVDDRGDVVIETVGGGVDLVRSTVDHVLADQVENLTLIGNSAFNGTGNALDNVLIGNAAANRLDGGAGADRMEGGDGNDLYVVDDAGDRVIELDRFTGGVDHVESSVSWTLGTAVEHLTLTGSRAIDGTGNALDNRITGNLGANRLSGGAGRDVLMGDAGDDQLDGGDGADELSGGLGADQMAGGAGDDRYVVDSLDDRVIELDGGGIDTVHAVVDWTLGDHVEHLSLVGGRAFRGTGNDLDNHLVGNADANELLGGAGNDSLDGGTGPRFDLGVRVDRLVGGTGDDTYLVRGVYDEVVEQAGEGIDRVVAFIDWTLGGHVEHLTLAADGNGWSATGNALDNTIFGNALANQIDGAAGDDLLQGGGGADRYRFSAGWGRDRIVDAVAAGSAASGTAADDGAVDSIAFDATVAAGDLVLGRSGSDLVIERRGAADRIVAVDFFGNDTSTGRVERIEFADGQAWTRADVERRMPVVTPPPATQPGAGDPTATGPVGATPPAANPAPDPSSPSSPSSPAGNTVLPSAGPVPPAATTPGGAFAQPSGSTPAGGASPQRHTGGTAADQLFGGSGDDWLAGGHGNDRLAGGTGSDTYVFGRGNGVDTIVESGGASAGHDVLQFGEGIRADQIWFSRSGQDLEIRLVGSADRTTVSGWYDGSGPRIEEFRTASGARLLESQVQQLVEAMAAFAPPAPGQTTLPLPHQMHLLPVLAANWS